MRILFAASAAIAIPCLKAVSELEMEGTGIVLAGLLTNPDRQRGHGKLEPSDVSAAAGKLDAVRSERGLAPLVQLKPEKLDSSAREEAAALSPDLLVSFAYGRFFGPRFLSLFPLGGINVHPSLLPKYRGASPIPAAILAREGETGICIQRLAAEMDSGDILVKEVLKLYGRETTLTLGETISGKAALLLKDLLLNFASISARPQEGEAAYCREIKKEAGLIDWHESAAEIDAQIRAYTPWPLSFTFRGKERLLVLEAADSIITQGENNFAPGTVLGKDRGILIQTGNGVLAVLRLQWQTKKALDWKAFLNGERDFLGTRLG